MSQNWSFTIAPDATKVKLRPCTVNGEKALFHRWEDYAMVVEASPLVGGAPAGQIRIMHAIVEMHDGTVKRVQPENVTFADTGKYITLVEGGNDGE